MVMLLEKGFTEHFCIFDWQSSFSCKAQRCMILTCVFSQQKDGKSLFYIPSQSQIRQHSKSYFSLLWLSALISSALSEAWKSLQLMQQRVCACENPGRRCVNTYCTHSVQLSNNSCVVWPGRVRINNRYIPTLAVLTLNTSSYEAKLTMHYYKLDLSSRRLSEPLCGHCHCNWLCVALQRLTNRWQPCRTTAWLWRKLNTWIWLNNLFAWGGS